MKKIFTSIGVMLILLTISTYAQIKIDGDMSDWNGIPALDQGRAAEKTGDVSDANFDLKHMYVTHDTSNVYVKIDFADGASFANYKNDPNEVVRFFMDTQIGTGLGLYQAWWGDYMSYWVDLGPNLNPDSTNKIAYLYYYEGDSATTDMMSDSKLIADIPMAVNQSQNSIEFSIPRDTVNFGQFFRPLVIASSDPSNSSNNDYMPDAGSQYLAQYDFWYGGSVVQVSGQGINSAITIDGQMLDWVAAGIPRADTGAVVESLGDQPTGPEFDVKDFYVTSDSEYLYIKWDIDPSATFDGMYTNYSGAPNVQILLDTELGDTTGIGYGGFWTEPADYYVDLSTVLSSGYSADTCTIAKYVADYDGAFETWQNLDGVYAYFAKNSDDNGVEVAIPRKPLHMGSIVRPWLYVVGNDNWDNEEYVPNSISSDWVDANNAPYTIDYNFYTGSSVKMRGSRPIVTGIKDRQTSDVSKVKGFGLVSNYPNPFNPSTTISFTLPKSNRVTIDIYNILGEKVRTLINNSEMSSGRKEIKWNGKNQAGNTLSSGVYIYRIHTPNNSVTNKMMMLK